MEIRALLYLMIWPALITASTMSFLDFILDGKKSSKIMFIGFGIVGLAAMVWIIQQSPSTVFWQLYLFMFFLSISLVILALKKRIDAFTIIGIILMIVMLILLLRFSLIEP